LLAWSTDFDNLQENTIGVFQYTIESELFHSKASNGADFFSTIFLVQIKKNDGTDHGQANNR
jgi:hypothetical protein